MRLTYSLFINLLLMLFFSFFLNTNAIAKTIEVNALLPTLTINNKGAIDATGNFHPWSSRTDSDKQQLLFYLAGRPSAKKMIAPLTRELQKIKTQHFHLSSIVNGSDVTLGASAFVIKELIANKRKYPHTNLVFDAQGKGLHSWKLNQGSAATFVLDANKRVLFFKQGQLNAQDVSRILALLNINNNSQ